MGSVRTIYEAMHGGVWGLGADSAALCRELDRKSPSEIDAIAREYRDHYQRDLAADIDDELDGDAEARARALLAGDQITADVHRLHEAAKTGFFVDEEAIVETLEQQSPESLAKMRELYVERFGRRLDTDMLGAVGLDVLPRVNALLQGRAPIDTVEVAEPTPSDAEKLRAAVFRPGTDEETVHRVLDGRSSGELDGIRGEYRSRYGSELDADVLGELSGRDHFDAEMALRGTPATLDERMSRLEETYQYERGDAVSNAIVDVFSAQGPRIDAGYARARRSYEAAAASEGGIDPTEASRIEQLARYADEDVGTYRGTKDAVAEGTATAATATVVVGVAIASGGTMTPLELALLGTAGAGTRAGTARLVQGNAFGSGDLVEQAGRGAVDGVTAGLGMRAGAEVATKTLGATASASVVMQGQKLTRATVAAEAKELLENSFALRAGVGAIEGAVDGAVGGGLGAGVSASIDDQTWDDGFSAGASRVMSSGAIGAAFGVGPGTLGGGFASRYRTTLADGLLPPGTTLPARAPMLGGAEVRYGESFTVEVRPVDHDPDQPALAMWQNRSYDHSGALFEREEVPGLVWGTRSRLKDQPRGFDLDGQLHDANGRVIEDLSKVSVFLAHGWQGGFQGMSTRTAARQAAQQILEARKAGHGIEYLAITSCKQGDRGYVLFGETNAQTFQRYLDEELKSLGARVTVLAPNTPGSAAIGPDGRIVVEGQPGWASFVPAETQDPPISIDRTDAMLLGVAGAYGAAGAAGSAVVVYQLVFDD